jgi:hypothetical protein
MARIPFSDESRSLNQLFDAREDRYEGSDGARQYPAHSRWVIDALISSDESSDDDDFAPYIPSGLTIRPQIIVSNLQSLDLSGLALRGDEILPQLSMTSLTNIRRLIFRGNYLDMGFVSRILHSYPMLDTLDASSCGLSSKTIRSLIHKSLQSLDLSNNEFPSDIRLVYVRLPSLDTLSFAQSAVEVIREGSGCDVPLTRCLIDFKESPVGVWRIRTRANQFEKLQPQGVLPTASFPVYEAQHLKLNPLVDRYLDFSTIELREGDEFNHVVELLDVSRMWHRSVAYVDVVVKILDIAAKNAFLEAGCENDIPIFLFHCPLGGNFEDTMREIAEGRPITDLYVNIPTRINDEVTIVLAKPGKTRTHTSGIPLEHHWPIITRYFSPVRGTSPYSIRKGLYLHMFAE